MRTNILKNANKITVVIVALVAGCLVGCQKEEFTDQTEVFLDLDIAALSDGSLTEQELFILQKGQKLIDAHAKYQNGKFILTVKDGSEIGISDRLFNFYIEAIENINKQIKGLDLIEIEPLIFQNVDNITIKPVIRLKNETENNSNTSSSMSSSYGPGYYQVTLNLTHTDAMNYINNMQTANSVSGFIASLGSSLASLCGGFLTSSYSLLNGLAWGDIESSYLNNSSQQGIRIVQTTYTGSTIPGYTFYAVYDITNGTYYGSAR
jgi:hypothetical protein